MKFASWLSLLWLLFAGQSLAADPAHALRQAGREVVFHYGVVPAQVVLAHPDKHPEREMHQGVAPKGASHLVVALFDAAKGERIARAEVTATVSLLGGPSVTKRLEPMTVADQPSFGGFFTLGMPGIYKLRFEARAPGIREAATAEFEYRVSPEGRR
jgi:hypothetical protein